MRSTRDYVGPPLMSDFITCLPFFSGSLCIITAQWEVLGIKPLHSHLHTLTCSHPHSSPNSSETLRANREAQRKATHNEGTVEGGGEGRGGRGGGSGGWR